MPRRDINDFDKLLKPIARLGEELLLLHTAINEDWNIGHPLIPLMRAARDLVLLIIDIAELKEFPMFPSAKLMIKRKVYKGENEYLPLNLGLDYQSDPLIYHQTELGNPDEMKLISPRNPVFENEDFLAWARQVLDYLSQVIVNPNAKPKFLVKARQEEHNPKKIKRAEYYYRQRLRDTRKNKNNKLQ